MTTNNPFLEHPPLKPSYKSPEDEVKANALMKKLSWRDPILLSEYMTEAARLGHPEAMYLLSKYYYRKISENYNPIADSLMREAARSGYKLAIFEMYYRCNKGTEESLQWFILGLEYGEIYNLHFSKYNARELLEDLLSYVKNKIITIQYGVKLLHYAAKYWDNKAAKGLFVLDEPIYKKYYGIDLIPIEDYLSFAKDVRRGCVEEYSKDFAELKAKLAEEENRLEMSVSSQEASQAYGEGYYEEYYENYTLASQHYRRAAESGHAEAAWRLVSLLPMLRETSHEEVEKWRQVAKDLGHPIANDDIHAILRLAEDGDSEASEYLMNYCESKLSNKTGLDHLKMDNLRIGFKNLAKDMCEAVLDAQSAYRLVELKGGHKTYDGREEVKKYLRYTIIQWYRLTHITSFNRNLLEVQMSKIYSLSDRGLNCSHLFKERASWMDYQRREQIRQMEYERELMEEQREEQMERTRERARAMKEFREKLDHEERIRNVLFTGSADTDFESYAMGLQSADQYYINETLREEKEKKFRKSLGE